MLTRVQAEATEVAKEGNIVFSFKVNGHKHSFEASNNTERDGWVVAVEKTVEEAKAAAEGVTSSEEYKETIEKLGMFHHMRGNVGIGSCVNARCTSLASVSC